MEIKRVKIQKIGSQLIANQKLVEETHSIARFHRYNLVKVDKNFYLLIEPDFQDGIWHGFALTTEVAIGIKKEFNTAGETSLRGPKLLRVIQAAFDQDLW